MKDEFGFALTYADNETDRPFFGDERRWWVGFFYEEYDSRTADDAKKECEELAKKLDEIGQR